MSFAKLSKTQLRRYMRGAGGSPYTPFLRDLKPGEGGRTTVEEEGVTKQTIKNRLNSAAKELGVKIKFRHSPANEVLFEIQGS